MNDIILKTAKICDAENIHNLMQAVYKKLDNKKIFVCDNLSFIEKHIETDGFTVIAQNKQNEIVGCFIFRFPNLSNDNLGFDIGLNKCELRQVVHMESAVVLPEYRGENLQLKMLQYGENLIDTDKYKYFLATVSPDNPASYKSLEKNGYKLILTKEKYNGLNRRIYLKEVT